MEVVIKGRLPKLDTLISRIIKEGDKYIIESHLIEENRESIPYTFYTYKYIPPQIIAAINKRDEHHTQGFLIPSLSEIIEKYGNIPNEKPLSLDDFRLDIGIVYNPNIPIPYYLDFRSILITPGKLENILRGLKLDENNRIIGIELEGDCAAYLVKKKDYRNLSYVLHLEDAEINSLINYLNSPTHLIEVIGTPKDRLYGRALVIDTIDENVCEKSELYPYRIEIFEMFSSPKTTPIQ
jgi:hypothetical protein